MPVSRSWHGCVKARDRLGSRPGQIADQRRSESHSDVHTRSRGARRAVSSARAPTPPPSSVRSRRAPTPPGSAATWSPKFSATSTFPISRSIPAPAIAACTTASSTISATPRRRCCSASMRRPRSRSRTATPRSPARRWRRRCIPMSGCSTPPWRSSTPGATACPSSFSAPPGRSMPPSAGRGSTGFTPPPTRARSCATTPSGTTSRPPPPPRANPCCGHHG